MGRVKKDRRIFNRRKGLDIYKKNYWKMTDYIKVKINTGEKRKKGK